MQPQGVVFTSAWMLKKGYSFDLQKQYRRSNWFTSIGKGAMVRTGDKLTMQGALFSLQHQLLMNIHIGGKSALELYGKAHYLNMGKQKIVLFGPCKEMLPAWFVNYEGWKDSFTHIHTDFLPVKIGMSAYNYDSYEIRVSAPARAMLECLFLTPKDQSIAECAELMEGLTALHPQQVQHLLEECKSVKVKRLFLYLAERANHGWVKHLNIAKIDLGSGKRSIVSHGIYDKKYQITIPKELVSYESDF